MRNALSESIMMAILLRPLLILDHDSTIS